MKKLTLLLSLILLVTCFATSAMALGTLAGKTISNQAYVDYGDANGNSLPRAYSNTITVTVSQVAGVSIQPVTSTQSGANSTDITFLVEIHNTGNGPDTFDFTYSNVTGWTPSQVKFYYDTNHNHVYDSGIDTPMSPVVGQTYKTGVVVPDDDYDILMVVSVPTSTVTAPDQSTSQTRITATSEFNPTVTSSGNFTVKVSTAVLTVVKNHTPMNAKPGDLVTYTVTVRNSGSAAASTVQLSDVMPTQMVYASGTISLNGSLKSDALDADEANFGFTTASAVTVNLATLASGSTATVVFQTKVRDATPAGTLINNTAHVQYTIGANTLTVDSNLDSDTCGTLASISLTPATQAMSGNPGDQKIYILTLTNNGNATDNVKLTDVSTMGWGWDIWVDADSNGIPGTGGDYKLTMANGSYSVSLPMGATIKLLAVMTIPPGSPDRTVDTTTLTGTSSLIITVTTSSSMATTVTAPVFTLTKAVNPTGSQPPGTTLVYTVTLGNSGTGLATKVQVTDAVPQYTTYVPSSIKTGPSVPGLVVRTDSPDGDGAMYDSAANAVIIGGPTQLLSAGSNLVFQFSAIIN